MRSHEGEIILKDCATEQKLLPRQTISARSWIPDMRHATNPQRGRCVRKPGRRERPGPEGVVAESKLPPFFQLVEQDHLVVRPV